MRNPPAVSPEQLLRAKQQILAGRVRQRHLPRALGADEAARACGLHQLPRPAQLLLRALQVQQVLEDYLAGVRA